MNLIEALIQILTEDNATEKEKADSAVLRDILQKYYRAGEPITSKNGKEYRYSPKYTVKEKEVMDEYGIDDPSVIRSSLFRSGIKGWHDLNPNINIARSVSTNVSGSRDYARKINRTGAAKSWGGRVNPIRDTQGERELRNASIDVDLAPDYMRDDELTFDEKEKIHQQRYGKYGTAYRKGEYVADGKARAKQDYDSRLQRYSQDFDDIKKDFRR